MAIRLVPRARQDAVEGCIGDALKIRLRAPPVDGQANVALIRFLAKALGVSPSRVELRSGATGRSKSIRVHGVALAEVQARLAPATAAPDQPP